MKAIETPQKQETARCPGCGAPAMCFPFGYQGRRPEYAVTCERPDCWRGPIGLSEKAAVKYWNLVAAPESLKLSPPVESENRWKPHVGSESSDASGELDFAGGDQR